MNTPDWRVNPFRDDLAAAYLTGKVKAQRFAMGQPATVAASSALLFRQPLDNAVVDSELLFGEQVDIYDEVNGWAWVQNRSDQYVGYVRSAALRRGSQEETHRIGVSRTYRYRNASIKTGDHGLISLNAPVCVVGYESEFAVLAGDAGYIFAAHLVPASKPAMMDVVMAAGLFLHAPYRWGGRTSLGLDCSGLVQMALIACGMDCPRDTDMQEQALGALITEPVDKLRRGDLVFWKGHVGFIKEPGVLLHATGHTMRVIEEPLDGAVARIASQGLPVTSVKRL